MTPPRNHTLQALAEDIPVMVDRAVILNPLLGLAAKGAWVAITALGVRPTLEALLDLDPDREAALAALEELQAAGLIECCAPEPSAPPTYGWSDTPCPRCPFVPGSACWNEWHSPVYYVRRPDGAVKIGFTGALPRRMKELTRKHGPLTLLATEPGGGLTETARHKQFRRLWIRGEWFNPGEELLRHVATLAETAVNN